MHYRFLSLFLFNQFIPIKYVNFFENPYHRTLILTAKSLLLSIVIMTLTQMIGCSMNVNVKAGNKPNIDALEKSLIIGVSTEQDVLKALGTPIGDGGVILPFMNAPKKSWTYYYEEGDLKDSRRLFLFVFFANQHYDGYLWFSSLPEFQPRLGN